MAEFFAVFNTQEALSPTGEISDGTDKNSESIKTAKVVKVTGTNETDVRAYIRSKFAPLASLVTVVAEANWKTS